MIQLAPSAEDVRTGLSVENIRQAFLDNLFYVQGRYLEVSNVDDHFKALAYTLRDRLLRRWVSTVRTYQQQNPRTVCYLSAEYLPGPFMGKNLLHLGIEENTRAALAALGLDLDELIDHEEEPGLGNGGLGRLAACFMESLATLQIPAVSYGIRYENGIFTQRIVGGEQVETTDHWLRYGNPWEVKRPNIAYPVKLGGYTESYRDHDGQLCRRWIPSESFLGVAVDTPIPGYRVETVNVLRLWTAVTAEGFDFALFNQGDYAGAVAREVRCETISKVLYPNDDADTGKRLRLLQQHFFVTCSLQDMLRIHQSTGQALTTFHQKFAVQLNDTHPAIAVAELMRLLVDKHRLDWESAWHVTRHTFAYTNHTLMPEALEKWAVDLFAKLLPRHLEIIYEINARFLDEVRMRFPFDEDLTRRLSLIDESGPRYVRMAHLACVGSHTINGVAQLHSRLLQETVLADFYRLTPEKFQNKTNGVTPRRFLMLSNPGLAQLLRSTIGTDWESDLTGLRALEPWADDPDFQASWRACKRASKLRLSQWAESGLQVRLDPDHLFDVQAKRIHEYKRQHLNVLYILTLYHRLKCQPGLAVTPRCFLFGGKAAPGYTMAKSIIRLIVAVGEVINRDPEVRERLQVVFLPNFSVKLGQLLYPAADVSQQISTAGKEASGTGNMKFSLNGALTVGTLDGANVEIRAEVGAENFFLFGMTAEQVDQTLAAGYQPYEQYRNNESLRAVLDLIGSGLFSHGERAVFRPLVDNLLQLDPYLVLADYPAYVACQDEVARTYCDATRWTRMSILNVARMGKFSSDRTIMEYCRDIWKASPVPVRLM